ncbi:MAG: hypothetical protein ACJAYF_002586 [Arenicella sp.]|jgi:hypothetical protein
MDVAGYMGAYLQALKLKKAEQDAVIGSMVATQSYVGNVKSLFVICVTPLESGLR